MGKLFGTDGIRGIANTELTCQLAASVGKALSTVLKKTDDKKLTVLLGCDTRRSSDMLSAAMISGICSAGADVVFIGCAPTPAVAYLTKKHGFHAGVIISASHNPSEYNGIKIFSSDGVKLPDSLEEEIEKLINECAPFPSPIGSRLGKVVCRSEEYLTEYIEYLKSTVEHRPYGIKVALDCATGAASSTAKRSFSELGATVYPISAEPNGDNINKACGSTHLDGLKEYVKAHKLDVGFAFDGDADRCICVDSDGNEIDGDRIMAICALELKKCGKLKNNTVVGTVMTNLGFTKFCSENGIAFIATKVGDRFVSEEMINGDFSLGGEQSGHVIFRHHSTTGDGQLTALQVLSVMKRTGSTVKELASVMKVYPQITVNLPATAEAKQKLLCDSEIKAIITEAANTLSPDGRLLVRPSGTEPLIRVMAEGADEGVIHDAVHNLAKKLQALLP